jgi:hypothetical protein
MEGTVYFQILIKDIIRRMGLDVPTFAAAISIAEDIVLDWLTGDRLPTDRELLVLALCFGKERKQRTRAFALLQRIRDVDSRMNF